MNNCGHPPLQATTSVFNSIKWPTTTAKLGKLHDVYHPFPLISAHNRPSASPININFNFPLNLRMMADLDRKPFWTQQKAWYSKLETSICKIRFRNSCRVESEVIPDDRTHSIEFFISLTYQQFLQVYSEQKWSKVQGYTWLTKVLNGTLKITWKEVLDSPDFADPALRMDDCWETAISQLICKFLNYKRPCDVQNQYHETQ